MDRGRLTGMTFLPTMMAVLAGIAFLVHHRGDIPGGLIDCLILLCALVLSTFVMPFPSMRPETVLGRTSGKGKNKTNLLFRPQRP